MPPDFPLPLSSSSPRESVDPWAVEQEPTTLIGFWPGDETPTKTEVVKLLEQFVAVDALEQIDELEGGAIWNGVFALPNITSPVIIWTEPAKPVRPGELNDAFAESRKWVVGFETMLDRSAPIDEYATLLRAMAGGLACTTILDPITHRYWQAQALADLTDDCPAEISAEDLWTIHAVTGDDQRKSASAIWLHTHGLWRCGCPELEMLEVSREYSGAAARLLNEVAELTLYAGLAAPGEVMEIGPQLSITAQPWQQIAPHIDSSNSGGLEDRAGDDNPHAGVRAVICSPKPRGTFRKLWTWPQDALRIYKNNDAIIYRTANQSARQEHLAREKWDELPIAFANAKPGTFVCLIKAGFDTTHDSREHLWLEVQRFEKATAHAKVVSHPLHVPSVKHGDLCRIDRDKISDWALQTQHGRFGPQHVPAMWRSIRMLKGDHAPS